MQIQPTNNLGNVNQAQMGSNQIQTNKQSSFQTPVDQVEFSQEAQMMMNGVGSDFRADKVADLRMQIASGRYETPEKIELAVERLLDEIA
ncbi:MAG: flagellar biosynthesis anti-sigma factor FlgM [Pirellulaceae bacterium]